MTSSTAGRIHDDGRRRTLARPAVAVAGLVALVCGLVAVGVVPRWSGAIHLVALPPLDLVADARWLLTHSPSWGWFAVGAVASLAVRITVLAVVLGRGGVPAWRPAATFYAIAAGPALVAAQFDFIAHAAMYARIFGGSLAVAAISFLVLASLPWLGRPGQRARLRDVARRGFRVEVTVPYAVVLVALGAAVEAAGPAWVVAAVPVSAALTAAAVALLRRGAGLRPAVALPTLLGIVVVVAAVTLLSREDDWQPSGADRDGSLLIMSGINSSSGEGAIFELEPWPLGYDCDQTHYFSYADTGDGQPRGVARCPITTGAPYVPEDTQRPLAEQVELLAAQAAELEPPVVVLAHSQAAWVAWRAAAERRLAAGISIVLVGPFPSSPAGYPPPGERGPGRVAGDILRALQPIPHLFDFEFAADAPLARELLATPDASRRLFGEPLPGDVRALSATTSSDTALMPDGWRIDGASNVCPIREAHPYLPVTAAFSTELDRFLSGQPPRHCPPWAELYRLVAQPLGVPPVR